MDLTEDQVKKLYFHEQQLRKMFPNFSTKYRFEFFVKRYGVGKGFNVRTFSDVAKECNCSSTWISNCCFVIEHVFAKYILKLAEEDIEAAYELYDILKSVLSRVNTTTHLFYFQWKAKHFNEERVVNEASL